MTARPALLKAYSSTTATKPNISAPTKTATRICSTAKYNYILHFDKDEIPQTLPLGFWSITIYGSDFQLVKNPINRFSIGDRTKGIVYGPDGSLDINIQHAAPQGKESNWLPCPPNGLFRLNYRIYLPAEAARQPATLGKYLPPIKKIQ